jgi:hypothetical protein
MQRSGCKGSFNLTNMRAVNIKKTIDLGDIDRNIEGNARKTIHGCRALVTLAGTTWPFTTRDTIARKGSSIARPAFHQGRVPLLKSGGSLPFLSDTCSVPHRKMSVSCMAASKIFTIKDAQVQSLSTMPERPQRKSC